MDSTAPRRRVVIVDDNRGFRFAAEVFLRSLQGVDVAGTAADGEQGIDLIERLKPDAAIIDIGMPGLNGFEVAARLRDKPGRPGIVLVSMNVDQTTRTEAYRLGADAVVSKVDFVDQLPRMLEAIFLGRADCGQA
jgi:DNA-binding NarL/FixJ family response regulator